MRVPDDGADLLAGLPDLDRPLGSLGFRLAVSLGPDEPFTVPGRRAHASGTARETRVWLDDRWLVSGPVVPGSRVRTSVETPLGVERRLDLAPGPTVGPEGSEGAAGPASETGREPTAASDLTERIAVSRDAPVVWFEWTTGVGAEGPGPRLELEWRVSTETDASEDRLDWWHEGRGLLVARPGSKTRLLFVLSAEPESLDVDPGEGRVRVRAAVPAGGLRLAVTTPGPADDAARLLRIARRTDVAVRARKGAVSRVLADGLRIATPGTDLDAAVSRARLRLDATRIGTGPGPGWVMEDAVRDASTSLAAGDFDAVLAFLELIAGQLDGGRVPARGHGHRALSYDDDRAGPLFLLLVARYLAWTGDRHDVRRLWRRVVAVVEACRDVDFSSEAGASVSLRATALDAAAVVAEEIGEAETATTLRDAVKAAPAGRLEDAAARSLLGAGDAGDDVIAQVVHGLLGAEPDAPRGRLVLRPRPPAEWDRFEVRGLALGPAAVDVAYEREGGHHRFTVRQRRGAAPLGVVLEPELTGGGVPAVRVDGEAADLDVERIDDRLRVPVQLVLDHPRTLDVELVNEPVTVPDPPGHE